MTLLLLPARVPSSLPLTVADIRATIKRDFPGMVLGYDAGFGWVLGTPAPRKVAGMADYRVDIDQMVTPCHVAMKMTPRLLIGGRQAHGLTMISAWLQENTPAAVMPLAA